MGDSQRRVSIPLASPPVWILALSMTRISSCLKKPLMIRAVINKTDIAEDPFSWSIRYSIGRGFVGLPEIMAKARGFHNTRYHKVAAFLVTGKLEFTKFNIHCLSTAYALPMHCLFTAYSLPTHCVFTAYPLSIRCLFAAYSLPIHCLCTAYSLPIHWLPMAYPLYIPCLFTV